MADVVSILSKQSTMTRWYWCRDCNHQFQETTAITFGPHLIKCPGEECGKVGFCTTYPGKR